MPDHLLYLLQLPDVLCYIFAIVLLLQPTPAHSPESQNATNDSNSPSLPGGHETFSLASSSLETLKLSDTNPNAQDTADHLPVGPTMDGPPYQPPATPPVIVERSAPIHAHKQGGSSPNPLMNSPRAAHFHEAHHEHLQAPVTASQFSPLPPTTHSPQLQGRSPNSFYSVQNIYDSRNVSVEGTMNTVIYTNSVSGGINNFMEKLLEKTIPGAAFDSSARYPPPRCHPGTRLAILERCLHFIVSCTGHKKLRWVFGAAGVGKSAVMQSVTEAVAQFQLPSVTLCASIFFFVNGRSDGTKAIITLAYQLSAKSELYRQFIEHEVNRDPSLLDSSMFVQFGKFIVQPFIHHPQLSSTGRTLLIIDGLDECTNPNTQRDLLQLISDFCLAYPSSPIVWIIASRPESHITSFFSQPLPQVVYEKEEIRVDSNQAREDVERFLRDELTKIRNEFSLNLRVQWPRGQDFLRLARASGGLFIYARTVVKYIGDRVVGDPTEQLKDVLKVIDAHPLAHVPREDHPMALLDALYSQILSNVSPKVRGNMRKILLALVADWQEIKFRYHRNRFIVLCNWLGMTSDEVYAALRHLSSVLDVPSRDTAHKEQLRHFHKSFLDYVSDFARSGFSPNIEREAQHLYIQCAFRILEQVPDGINVDDLDYDVPSIGRLIPRPDIGGDVVLTWPADEVTGWHERWDEDKMRSFIYRMAIERVVEGIQCKEQAFHTVFCIRLLATCFQWVNVAKVENLAEVVFDKSRRSELTEQGLLQHLPLEMFYFDCMSHQAQLRLYRPGTSTSNVSGPWDSSCLHQWHSERKVEKDQTWSTKFSMRFGGESGVCGFCCDRFARQLEACKTRSPGNLVPVLFTSAGLCFVEFRFLDPEDGMSEWTYWVSRDFF